MARILVTRPEEDAASFADILTGLGHQVQIEPLLSVRLRTDASLDTAGAQALLFTSANGVRAAARLTEERGLPALCVGDATARAAHEAGFDRIESAAGDVHDLAELVRGKCRPEAGPLVHVAGTISAGDLAGELTASGFEVRRAVVYETEAALRLSGEARAALADRRIDAVTLFSPRTARTFARIVQEAGLAHRLGTVDLLCLSAAVAETLDALPRRRLLVAAEPTQNALIELIQ
ncbi:uroporphyrinogen-III synthase [Emcibacter sp. SYSU 3D8]|uniref:uroporphyrinogen-III synthase n=1 Tax=Emcibacter sp. SYSU 3D8 TaxID=3133969 RepID=UPI0031FE4F15